MEKIEMELDRRLEEHWHNYTLGRRNLLQEEKSINYYLKLAENVKKCNEDGEGQSDTIKEYQ